MVIQGHLDLSYLDFYIKSIGTLKSDCSEQRRQTSKRGAVSMNSEPIKIDDRE